VHSPHVLRTSTCGLPATAAEKSNDYQLISSSASAWRVNGGQANAGTAAVVRLDRCVQLVGSAFLFKRNTGHTKIMIFA